MGFMPETPASDDASHTDNPTQAKPDDSTQANPQHSPKPADEGARTAGVSEWLEGARPHTWANAFAPVVAGTGAAALYGGAHLGRALLALLVAWCLIVGVNFANDYSDGIRGTDEDRSGPLRLTGSGLVPPQQVKYAAFAAFGLAAIFGIALSLLSNPWLILIGALCIAGAWFYTGGSHPYGYMGLGEISVFIFFGLVAVLGTEFTQLGRVTWVGVACAVGIGSISAGVNLANNLRDIPTDAQSGKITLAVRLGDRLTRMVLPIMAFMPIVMSVLMGFASINALWAVIAVPLIFGAILPVIRGAEGKALIPVLGGLGRGMLLWAIITALGLALA